MNVTWETFDLKPKTLANGDNFFVKWDIATTESGRTIAGVSRLSQGKYKVHYNMGEGNDYIETEIEVPTMERAKEVALVLCRVSAL